MLDAAGNAAAPAANCKNLRRGSFISPSQRIIEILGSVRLDTGELDHLGPLFGVVGDKLAEVGGRTWKHPRAQLGKPRLELGVGQSSVDLPVELVDDLGRRVLGYAN